MWVMVQILAHLALTENPLRHRFHTVWVAFVAVVPNASAFIKGRPGCGVGGMDLPTKPVARAGIRGATTPTAGLYPTPAAAVAAPGATTAGVAAARPGAGVGR